MSRTPDLVLVAIVAALLGALATLTVRHWSPETTAAWCKQATTLRPLALPTLTTCNPGDR